MESRREGFTSLRFESAVEAVINGDVAALFFLNLKFFVAERSNVLVGRSYRPYCPDDELLLPPSLREWFSNKHSSLARWILRKSEIVRKSGWLPAASTILGRQSHGLALRSGR